MLFVGVDWAENHHDVCVMTEDGMVLGGRPRRPARLRRHARSRTHSQLRLFSSGASINSSTTISKETHRHHGGAPETLSSTG